MAQCTYSSDCGPYLTMVVEPETKTRFRYESEGGSHGGLTGKNKVKGKKTYPTVKLENYSGSSKDIFIRVTLYTEKKTEHVLNFKKKKSSECQNYIDEYLSDDYTAEFKNLTILSKKKEDIYKDLMERRFKRLGNNPSRNAKNKCEMENGEAVKKEAKEILNSVLLRFDAFESARPDVQICPPLYSEPICNQKASSKGDLKIHRMSKVSGSWQGEEEVILLCDKVQRDNIKILFYEKDVENGWKAYASFNPADVHYQVAIPFKTPKYKENAEREVAVALERQGELSEPRSFIYIADNYPSKKRKMCAPSTVSSPMDISSGSSAAATSDDSSQEAMAFYNTDLLNYILDSDNSLDPPQNPSNEVEFIPSWELINSPDISPENMLAILSPLENVSNTEFQGIDESNDLFSFFPVNDIKMDVGQLVGQMACVEIGEPKSAHDTPKQNDKKESSVKGLENQKEKWRRYVNLKRDKCGNTLLHIAVLYNKNNAIVKLINVMDSDAINVQNCYKQTALHIAVDKNSDAVENLLINGGNPNIKNADGNNCYHIAAQNNFDKSMRDLLRSSQFLSEVNEFNYEGLTPLHIAIKKNSSCVDLLMKHYKTNLEVKEMKCGRSLLHYAVEYQPSYICPILEMEKIDVNVRDFEGNTPLHIACAIGNYDTVTQLLLANADPLIRNSKQNFKDSEEESSGDETPVGQTPADLTSNSKILELLKQASKKHTSGSIDTTDNSGDETLLRNLCNFLDADMRWELVAPYINEEYCSDILKWSTSPTKDLLAFMKRKSGEGYIEHFKSVLEMVDLTEAVQMITESNKPLIEL